MRRVGGGGWRGGYSDGWAFADFPLLVIVYPCCRQPPCVLQEASPGGKALPGRQRADSMRQRMHSVKGCKDATTKFRRKTPSAPQFHKSVLYFCPGLTQRPGADKIEYTFLSTQSMPASRARPHVAWEAASPGGGVDAATLPLSVCTGMHTGGPNLRPIKFQNIRLCAKRLAMCHAQLQNSDFPFF